MRSCLWNQVKFVIIFLSEEKWKKTKSVLDVSQEGLRKDFVTTQLDQTRAPTGKYRQGRNKAPIESYDLRLLR